MKKITLVLAAILAVGLSSGATAAFVVHTKNIANRAVTHAKLAKHAVKSDNIAAGSVEPGALASSVQSRLNSMQSRLPTWFLINQTGTILSQSGGVSQSPDTTDYKLSGVSNLADCAIEANAIGGASIDAGPSHSNDLNELDVQLPSGGASTGTTTYSVIVLCPAA